MRIQIHLLYHGQPIAKRDCNVYEATARTAPPKIDIGLLVDEAVIHALDNLPGKLENKYALHKKLFQS